MARLEAVEFEPWLNVNPLQALHPPTLRMEGPLLVLQTEIPFTKATQSNVILVNAFK